MRLFLKKVIDIREGEAKRTLIMASYIFVIIASHNILKPMARSLFVSTLGMNQLPYLYILLALVGGVVVVFYLRLANNTRLDRLINGTSIFLIINLFLFRYFLSLELHSVSLYYGLYIWASLYGVLTTTQFWLLANYLFNAREAKRLFPFITASAILGGIMGGYIARFMVKLIGGTPNLAFFCIGLLAMSIVLMNSAWQLREQSYERKRRIQTPAEQTHSFHIMAEVFTLIRNSRHLAFLVGTIAFTFMVVQIADFQFTAYAGEKFEEMDDLTGFLGFWVSNLSIIALLFQFLLASAIIRRFGVIASILFLPIALLLSSIWVFLSYGLISILAVKIGDGAFRHSINKVGTELLYLPIPAAVKKKTKAFVDMFVDRFARGIAGLLLIIFYSWFGLSIAQISMLSVVLIAVWLVFSVATYREYVNSFRQALAKGRIDADLLTVSIKDVATINSLIVSLASRNERQVVYALQLLDSVDDVDLVPPLRPLLKHVSSEVRLLSLQLLHHNGDSSLLADVQPLLHDQNDAIRKEAVRFFAKYSSASITEMLSKWLRDEDSGLRGAALFHIAEDPKLSARLIRPELIQSFLAIGQEGRAQVADALGILNDQNYYSYLMELIKDSDPMVKTRAIKSAGQTGASEFIPILMQNLSDRTYRKTAREALAAYGDTITEHLSNYLADRSIPLDVRAGIPRVLGLIGSQRAVEMLLDNLPQKDEILRYQMIKALNKLRAQFPGLHFDKRVDQALKDELKKYFRIQATLHQTARSNGHDGPGFDLLQRALRERLDDHLERLFRLLGLRYPPRDIYNT
ncbi:MAG: Npt1/Npt2 family nucleotide transporter, partial [bacterium]